MGVRRANTIKMEAEFTAVQIQWIYPVPMKEVERLNQDHYKHASLAFACAEYTHVRQGCKCAYEYVYNYLTDYNQ